MVSERFLSYPQLSDEEARFLARGRDLLTDVEAGKGPRVTHFCNPRELAFLLRDARAYSGVTFCVYGGFPDAERNVLCLNPWGIETPMGVDVLEIQGREDLEHRKILGSILHLGLDRRMVGDIRLRGNCAQIAVRETMTRFLEEQLTRVGGQFVATRIVPLEDIWQEPPPYRLETTTVSSLRIDAILAGAFHVSRRQIQEEIQKGNVHMDFRVPRTSSETVHLGSVLSLRRFGRVRLAEIGSVTRKNRNRITLEFPS